MLPTHSRPPTHSWPPTRSSNSTPLTGARNLYSILIASILAVYLLMLLFAHNRVEELHGNASAEIKEINKIATTLEAEHAEILVLIKKLEEEAKILAARPSPVIVVPQAEAAREQAEEQDVERERERELEEKVDSKRPISKPKPKTETDSESAAGHIRQQTPPPTLQPSQPPQPPPLPPPAPPSQQQQQPLPLPPITAHDLSSSLSQSPPPLTFNSPASRTTPSTLVVCGTDGSGTRRVVDVLTELGVLMVSEDPETFDIHGDLMGGWPPVVKPVIHEAKSISYDPTKLSRALHARATQQLTRLLYQTARDAQRPTSYKLAVGGALPRPPDVRASLVSFGFKAPVAMTLAPYWAHLLPHFKLLHVVRDGRDIAFSANQGPVEKFYEDMYGDNAAMAPSLMAIRLWSDWNAQLYRWADKMAGAAPGDGSRSFGYMALHSEDLVSSSSAVRFAALLSLAKWAGSNATESDICCMALEDAEYLGSHDRMERSEIQDAERHVSSKYGKWKAFVRADPRLGKRLIDFGGDGLKVLGYEPLRQLASALAPSETGFVCRPEAVKCKPKVTPAPYNAVEFAVPGMCSVHAGTDYKGDGSSDILTIEMKDEPGVYSPSLCCRLCKKRRGCRAFTVDVMNQICYLKSRRGQVVKTARTALLLSGDIL